MSNSTLEELELRLAYQDDALNQLSDTVYGQAQAIERLTEHCRRLESRVQALAEGGDKAPDETPPHY